MYMYIGSIHYASQQPFSPKEKWNCSGGPCESGSDSLHHVHHREAMASSSSQSFGPEATPASKSVRYPSEILNSIVEMREGQIASLRSLETGGCESAELKTIGILGKDAGIGVRTSSLFESEPHLNDAAVNAVPIRPKTVYVVLRLYATAAQDEIEWRIPRA